MSEQETLPTGVHPEVALLPWYSNGTLEAEERQRVAQHLESCPDCRLELDELTQMKRELTAAYAVQLEPSPQLARSIFAKVAQEATARRRAEKQSGSWLDGVDGWFRSLFMPQWVPAFAVLALAAQLGLLLWVTMPAQQEQIATRSIGGATATFTILFREQATEAQIRALLLQFHARIVSGPSSEQAYLVEVATGDPSLTAKALETLRARTDVIRNVEIHSP